MRGTIRIIRTLRPKKLPGTAPNTSLLPISSPVIAVRATENRARADVELSSKIGL
jgi:hypothetical protein